MIHFRDITIEDKRAFDEKCALEPEQMTERCFTDIFIWAKRYNTKIAIDNGFMFLGGCESYDGRIAYLFPIGKAARKIGLQMIIKDANERGKPYKMIAVSANQKAEIERDMPGKFTFEQDRDNFDYIYSGEDMRTLAGRKLHAKRNYINRFLQTYSGRYSFEIIDAARDKADIMKFQSAWCENNDPNLADTAVHETYAIELCLDNFEALGMRGGILRIEGEIVAFTMGCALTADTFVVQIEKALADIDGAYPLISREFLTSVAAEFEFINREEDMGIMGLRAAKMSYNPVKLVEKYIMVAAND